MSAMPTTLFEPYYAGIQIQFVVGNQDFFGGDFIEVGKGRNRLAT